MRVVGFVDDLMDRSRLQSALPGLTFALWVEEAAGADVVLIDIGRHVELVAPLRAAMPGARLVCFGPHVDADGAVTARAAGADVVWPRSRFFRDPAAALD